MKYFFTSILFFLGLNLSGQVEVKDSIITDTVIILSNENSEHSSLSKSEETIEGIVTLNICVDQDGNTIESETKLIPSKTTISDEKLIKKIFENARQWKFKPSAKKKSCGTITYNIKLE